MRAEANEDGVGEGLFCRALGQTDVALGSRSPWSVTSLAGLQRTQDGSQLGAKP